MPFSTIPPGAHFTLKPGEDTHFCMLATPHAGRTYSTDLLQALRVPPEKLLKLEDRHVDRLLGHARARGFGTLVAHAPRALIDLNRPLSDFDFKMVNEDEAAQLIPAGISPGRLPGPRARGGLGLIPRRLPTCGNLWNRRFSADEILARLDHIHKPYHATLERAMDDMADRHGTAILIDVHSMPPLPITSHERPAQIVIGDLHGTSAAEEIVAAIVDVAANSGLRVVRNNPYAGGYVLRRHGNVRRGRHAVQVEIDRRLYLDSMLVEPGKGLDAIDRMVADMADAAMAALGGATLAEAAE